jgi:hypothetical protein
MVGEETQGEGGFGTHRSGWIVEPRQQTVRDGNAAVTGVFADQAERVAGTLPRQLRGMVEQLQQRCNAGRRAISQRIADAVLDLAIAAERPIDQRGIAAAASGPIFQDKSDIAPSGSRRRGASAVASSATMALSGGSRSSSLSSGGQSIMRSS